MNFTFSIPTKLVVGKNCVRENAGMLAGFGKKALLVTGARSAKANGAQSDTAAALAANGQDWVLFDRVPANPTVDCVYAGAEAARRVGADFVIGIGGGSAMDAAKGIALLACEDIPRDKIFSGGYRERLPLCCVPTTAGTGSETTQYAILTNDAAQTKTSLASPVLFPDLALLDSRYLSTLSQNTMTNTVLDAFSHAAEGFLSKKASPLTDALALESIGVIAACFPALQFSCLTDEDRERLLYASMLGGMVIAHTGTSAVHSMGYSLTYFKHIEHGRANGLLLPAYLRFAERQCPKRVAALTEAALVPDVAALDKNFAALLGLREMITSEEIAQFSAIAVQAKNFVNGLAVPSRTETEELYREAFGLS